jgi:nitroreductase/NAD-dependent dihydropyrimidine dehydrogenase PreA subunit
VQKIGGKMVTDKINIPVIKISDECIKCGNCIHACPIGIVTADIICEEPKKFGKPFVLDADLCFNCGQCVAICPKNAISHSLLPMDQFPLIKEYSGESISKEQLNRLTRVRRSIRHFKQKEVPDEVLEEIFQNFTRYAPTGMNRQQVQILVVKEKALQEMLLIMQKSMGKIVALLKIGRLFSKQFRNQYKQILHLVDMEKKGLDPYTRTAKTAIFFVTNRSDPENATDATILSYQTALTAEVYGLATCYFGAYINYLPFARSLDRIIQVPKKHFVVCALLIGYPATTYPRLVPRNPMKIKFVK